MHAIPSNLIAERIRGALRFADTRAHADRAQHAPAVRDDLVVRELSAGVEHLPWELRGRLQPLDLVALPNCIRIAARGQYDAQRSARVPLRIGAISNRCKRR